MMFKSLNGLAPGNLKDLFRERQTDYEMSDSLRKLNLPKARTDYLKRSFGYSGALVWNSLPENIRTIRESSFNMTRGGGGGGREDIEGGLQKLLDTRKGCLKK